MSKKRILVSPLNWGIGHATRCIPIIRELEAQGAEVVIGTDGEAYKLLKRELPHLEIHETPSYNITYKTDSMVVNLGLQFPKIVYTTWKEYQWLKGFAKEHKIDGIISDSRFAMRHSKLPSILLVHQLFIITPPAVSNLCNNLLKKYWRAFDEIWVPDVEGVPNLSGILSHDTGLSATFIGPLSRLQAPDKKYEKKYEFVALISGPEPQRTRFEKMILEQVKNSDVKKALIIRGLPAVQERYTLREGIDVWSYSNGEELRDALLSTDLVVCRSGYSTLMDLANLGQKAFLCPTPGQTEQEYLGEHFMKQKVYYSQEQKNFDLIKGLKESKNYNGVTFPVDHDALKKAIAALLEKA